MSKFRWDYGVGGAVLVYTTGEPIDAVAHIIALGSTEYRVYLFPGGGSRWTMLEGTFSLSEAKSIVETLAPIYWSM